MTNFKFYLIVETVQFPAKTHIRNYFSVNREAANIAVESVGKKWVTLSQLIVVLPYQDCNCINKTTIRSDD